MSDNHNPSQEERNFAMFCHLGAFCGAIFPFGSIILPLVLWQIKKEQSAFIDYHGKEAVNFQLTMLIAFIIATVLIVVIIGIPLLIGLFIFDLVMIIIAGIKANDGIHYRYPFCIRFIK